MFIKKDNLLYWMMRYRKGEKMGGRKKQNLKAYIYFSRLNIDFEGIARQLLEREYPKISRECLGNRPVVDNTPVLEPLREMEVRERKREGGKGKKGEKKEKRREKKMRKELIYLFIYFYFILFYFILFYFILFYFIFYFIFYLFFFYLFFLGEVGFSWREFHPI